MGKTYVKLSVSKKNQLLLMNECKIEFLKKHPEFEDMNITQDFMLSKLIKYFLEKNILKL